MNKAVQISNMYGIITPNEYPHAPSFNLRDFDNPVLEMAIIKGADKTAGADQTEDKTRPQL